MGENPVTFLRVFKPVGAEQKDIDVTGWDPLGQRLERVIFERYLTKTNEPYLERKNG